MRHTVLMRSTFTGIDDLHESPRVAVVIDVMRAFTVAAWAFAKGAERIIFAESLDDARELKARQPDWLTLQDGAPLPGFDLVNSPALVKSADLDGRVIVQKSTAGTVGALAAANSEVLLCASFVVAAATADYLLDHGTDAATFVVTGEGGQAEEDLACAEYIASRISLKAERPDRYLDRARESTAAQKLTARAMRGGNGVDPADVGLCVEPDRFTFAMRATVEDARLVLRPVLPASAHARGTLG